MFTNTPLLIYQIGPMNKVARTLLPYFFYLIRYLSALPLSDPLETTLFHIKAADNGFVSKLYNLKL